MKELTIYQDNYSDSTVISNRFIDEYMKDANDAQIKVYLYLLRAMGAHRSTSVSEIADVFNHTEKDVLRALKYWEKKQLLLLEYDDAKSLAAIHFRELASDTAQSAQGFAAAAPLSLSAPAKPLPQAGAADAGMADASAANASAASIGAADADMANASVTSIGTAPAALTAAPSVSAPLQTAKTAQAAEDFTKPVYSLDDVRTFRSKADTEQLLFIVESYIGRPLTAGDIRTILFLCDRLHFSVDLIDYLVQYCVDRGKKDFRYIEKVAISWAEARITTPRQAASMLRKYDKTVYGIMNALGKSGAPTSREMKFIERWSREFGFPMEIIREACERTVLATDKHRFEYADRILSSWHQAGVQTPDDIAERDASFARSKAAQKQARPSANRFDQFTQNTYDFSALEHELLSN